MAEKVSFGIFGCGVVAPVHAAAIASLPDAQLVAVADILPGRAQKLATTYAVTAYTSLQDMLDNEPHLDVVNICTPSGYHGEHTCQVMRSGRHVIVEKPMEVHRAAVEEMLRVQQENHVKLAVVSQHRFDDDVMRVHELVQERAFGRLVLGNALVPWWCSQAYYDGDVWRGTLNLDGGGILINQSIHWIDLLQWLMGPVRSVYAYTDTLVHRMEGEDVAVAVLRFTNGALGTITATSGAYPGINTRIGIFGDKGSAILAEDKLSYLHLAGNESQQASTYRAENSNEFQNRHAIRPYKSHALQIADMIRAIREDSTPLVDGHVAWHPVEIILGIYESARTGKEVTLSLLE